MDCVRIQSERGRRPVLRQDGDAAYKGSRGKGEDRPLRRDESEDFPSLHHYGERRAQTPRYGPHESKVRLPHRGPRREDDDSHQTGAERRGTVRERHCKGHYGRRFHAYSRRVRSCQEVHRQGPLQGHQPRRVRRNRRGNSGGRACGRSQGYAAA